MPPPAAVRARVAGVAAPVTEAAAAEGCGRQEAPAAPTGSRPVPKPYQRVASVAMPEPSPLPPPNSDLRILFAKDCVATSSPSVPAVISSHADRDRIIGVFRTALSRNEAPEAFALQAVQEAIKPLKQTVLVLEENQALENALRRLLQELVAEKDEKMQLRHGEGREGRDRQVGHRAEEVRDRRWVHEGGSIIGRERQASL